MKTLIIYASKYGATEECAQKLEGYLDDEVTRVKMGGTADVVDLSPFDAVIIGGGIYAGKIRKPVRAFCEKNLEELGAKRVGLFISGLTPPEEAGETIEKNFPAELRSVARASAGFGGAVFYEKMNFLERFVMKRITKRTESFSTISDQVIREFAEKMKS